MQDGCDHAERLHSIKHGVARKEEHTMFPVDLARYSFPRLGRLLSATHSGGSTSSSWDNDPPTDICRLWSLFAPQLSTPAPRNDIHH
ncbi:hypothetical protein MJO29_013299 [Puccinia striiformis f. sp. tritici]|nr:hypothetical protein MJO29_013299 [Puccinia striiformis f. sp. tritici]